MRKKKTLIGKMKVGDRFTIEGFGTSAKGHQVRGGMSVKTGRKMKVFTLMVFLVSGK